jgi:hypothetical protein
MCIARWGTRRGGAAVPEQEPAWLVTLLDRGYEICVEVYGKTKAQARREAHELHPHGHIIHVERA